MGKINSTTIGIGIVKGWCMLQTLAVLSIAIIAVWCIACQLLFWSQTTITQSPGYSIPGNITSIPPLQFPTPAK